MTWHEMEIKHKQDWKEYDHYCHISFQKMQEMHLKVKQHYENLGQNVPPHVTKNMKQEFDMWNEMWGKDGKRINDIMENHLWQRRQFLEQHRNNPIIYRDMKRQIEEISYHYNKRDYMAYEPRPIETKGFILMLRTWVYNKFKIHI